MTAGARLAVLLALQLPDCEEVYRSELNKNALFVGYVNSFVHIQGAEATAGAADDGQNGGSNDARCRGDQPCWPLLSWRRRNG